MTLLQLQESQNEFISRDGMLRVVLLCRLTQVTEIYLQQIITLQVHLLEHRGEILDLHHILWGLMFSELHSNVRDESKWLLIILLGWVEGELGLLQEIFS